MYTQKDMGKIANMIGGIIFAWVILLAAVVLIV